MMVNELAAVTAALGGLRHAGSPGLEQRVFTGWLSASSRLGEVFVAFTRDGVQFVRSVESVGGDPATASGSPTWRLLCFAAAAASIAAAISANLSKSSDLAQRVAGIQSDPR